MNILITGAQLGNKGAESMLYVTTDELRKRFPECTVYFATIENYDTELYHFKQFCMSGRNVKLALGGLSSVPVLPVSILRDFTKTIMGKKINLGHYFDTIRFFKNIDVIVDVSGFSIGAQWSRKTHEYYLDRIALAKKYGIPVYLMPQSFGPFTYDQKLNYINKRLSSLLKYPRIIFAREKEGYDALVNSFNLNNVLLSNDLVLQNTGINWNNIFTYKPVIKIPEVCSERAVGIVPNVQCFKHQDKKEILKSYSAIIDNFLHNGFDIIIFRHSREDLDICKQLKEVYLEDDRVLLEPKEFSCFEYDKYIKNFCFIVCSRYHGIVHAYRNGVPAVILGWAEKYSSLAKSVNQEKYSFDVRTIHQEQERFTHAAQEMSACYTKESMTILNALERIQKDNCFDILEKDLRSIKCER